MSATSSEELRLIELVATPVQCPHNGVMQEPTIALEMLEPDLGVVSAVVQVERPDVTEPRPKVRRQRVFREVRAPERRGDKNQTGDSGPTHGFREVFQKDRGSEGMPHEDRSSLPHYQLVDAPRPGPVLRVLRPGHAWRLHAIARSQGASEERLPVHFATPAAGLTGAVNNEDSARHMRERVLLMARYQVGG